MFSLLQISFFNKLFLFAAVILYFVFPFHTTLAYLGLLLSLHQIMMLFNSIGSVIPTRYLFGAFMCLQFFIGPVFAYYGLDQYQYPLYRMQVPEDVYFAYAVPAIAMFILGLHIAAGNLKGEYVDVEAVRRFMTGKKRFPYILIGLGFIGSYTYMYFPSELGFVVYLMAGLKFVGLFIIVLSSDRLQIGPIALVIGFIVSFSLTQTMFHDLLTWLIFTGVIFSIRYKPNLAVKLAMSAGFILLAVVIQQLKTGLRSSDLTNKGSFERFADVYYQENQSNKIFGFASLAPSNVRINQGFIVTYIMKNVPTSVPFSNGGELYQIIEAAFLPRIIAPNKLQAGDRSIFMKYSGIAVGEGTSMGLSSVGDAYINFGVFGGSILMFFLGLGYSFILNLIHRYNRYFPVLILFSPLIFYYPIRPDSELQTSLGHAVKGSLLVAGVFYAYRRYLRYDPVENNSEDDWKDDGSISPDANLLNG